MSVYWKVFLEGEIFALAHTFYITPLPSVCSDLFGLISTVFLSFKWSIFDYVGPQFFFKRITIGIVKVQPFETVVFSVFVYTNKCKDLYRRYFLYSIYLGSKPK